MKIAHMTSVHNQNDNRIFYKECTTLVENGYDVTLIVAGGTNKLFDNGIKVIAYPKNSSSRLNRMINVSVIGMLKVCKQVDADVYHFHDPELMFAGIYLKLIGKKVIYDIHENNPAAILSKPYIHSKWKKKLLSKTFNVFEQFCSRFFDVLVTARPDITKKFRHKKVITLRNFPILPDFSKMKDIKITKEKPSVIFVGGMNKLRGINELLDAFSFLDEYELWLLGPISESQLAQRIKASPKNVKYFGVVEAYEVFSYIKKADIGIITFLPVPNHVETLATKPFEYMACEKPMIMSNFAYWEETFKDSSLYVNPSNVEDIIRVIKYLFGDREKMKCMGELNRKLSTQEYNWKKESEKLLDVYRSLEE